MLTGEPLGRMLLHLAVCIGVLDLQESAMELLAGPGHSAKGTEDQNNTEQPKPRQPPSKGQTPISGRLSAFRHKP